MNAQQATLTWKLVSDLSGLSDTPGITLSDVTYGNSLSIVKDANIGKSYNEGSGTLFSPIESKEYTSPRTDGSQTLTFAFSIPDGYSFNPSNVKLFAAADGSGNKHLIDVYFNSDKPVIEAYQPGRGSSNADTEKSAQVTNVELTGSNTLKIDLYGKPGGTTKGWCIGHVEIIGDLVDLSDPRKNANISWNTESTKLKIRDAFTAPVLNNPDNVPVTFTSSNKEVATVDENGEITLVAGGIGTTMISASYDGDAEGAPYKSTTANTTIEVVTNVTEVKAWEEYESVESIPLTQLYKAEKIEGNLAAGDLINDDNINIKTVASAKYTNYGADFLGYSFPGTVQLGRVSEAPAEGNLTGTVQSDSSPIVITPNVDCKVVMFVRRQSVEQRITDDDDVENNVITRTKYYGMSPNDGKSVYAAPHSAIDTKIDQNLIFGTPASGTEYMNCAIVWDMKAGETYTLYAINTTIAMQGIGYYLETGSYTIRYVENGKTVREVKKTGLLGSEIVLTDEDKADFTLTEGDVSMKYTYLSDDSEGKTITADETTVVTINMLGTNTKAPNVIYNWDFTNWSEATVNNLIAAENWSDDEKGNGTTVDNKCFWQVDLSKDLSSEKYLMANNEVIEELKGLVYVNTTNKRNLAIALDYNSTSLGDYHGKAYLWLGGGAADYFIIPGVPAGATIKMGVESHKTGTDKPDARGVKLSISGGELMAPNGDAVNVPITYTEQEWFVPATAEASNDVLIRNTNGCHIYYITVTHPDLQKYTLRYVAGEETLKEVVKTGNVNAAITLADEDKATITVTEDGFTTDYTYVIDNAEGKTIAEDGTTVVTITMLQGESVPAGWMCIPGTLDITHSSWNYDGLKLENDGANVGFAKNNHTATAEVYVKESGVYSMNIDFYAFYAESDFEIEITDQETGVKEIDTYYHISGVEVADILLEGNLTKGKKTIKYTFHSESTGYLSNYKNQTITKVGKVYATLKSVTGEGLEAAEAEGYDFNFNIPFEYEGETVKLKADLIGATLTVKAGETAITVSEEGVFELPVPAYNEVSEIALTLVPEEGALYGKTEYKLRMFHLGDVLLTGLTLDGLVVDEATVAAIQENKTGENIDGYIFTSLPKVVATFIDGNVVEATGKLADDQATATYTFQGKIGDKTADYSFTLEGFHIYKASVNDKTDVLKYKAEFNEKKDGNWYDGRYTITSNSGWEGTQFKMKGSSTTLTAPANMIIKQIILANLGENSKPPRRSKITAVKSGAADIYLPSASEFENKDDAFNLIINVENHVAGTPFEIEYEGAGEVVAWFEFIYESVTVELDNEAAVTNGETTALKAKLSQEGPQVVWSSDNEAVATVDEDGVVTGVSIGKANITATLGDVVATCAVKCYPQAGDADLDGTIALNDAVVIVNEILENNSVPEGWNEDDWKEFFPVGADANKDGGITISDASEAVEKFITLKNDASAQARVAAGMDEEAGDALVIGGVSRGVDGGSSVAVALGNTQEYVALQADIYMPEGVQFEVKAGSRIAGSHIFRSHRFDDNHVRIAIYNLGNEAFAENGDAMFEIVTDMADAADIALVNVIASDAAAKAHVLGISYDTTTGVAALGLDADAPVKVYDLNGRQVSDKAEGLEKGIYIVRQGDVAKKVYIR